SARTKESAVHRRLRAPKLSAAALVLAAAAGLLVPAPGAAALDNGTARTPPMGWNSWNSYGCAIDEQLIRDSADALAASGLREAGYRYVVVDDCWMAPERDRAGRLVADPVRFPAGIKALADHVHALGLRFGLYQVPTERTCAQRGGALPGATGSRGHERQDAAAFAEWGVDYLKYDWCSPEGTLADQVAAFTLMRDALRDTGRPIVYSINPNSYHPDKNGARYDWSPVANLWRTTEDITAAWATRADPADGSAQGVLDITGVNARLAGQAGPGHWNDPDMLEVGVGGLSDDEARTHLALWAQMAAPLIAGNRLTAMPARIRDLLATPGVIAVDQDPLGAQGTVIDDREGRLVVSRPLADGGRSVSLTNTGDGPAVLATTAAAAGLPDAGSYAVTDLWTGRTATVAGPSVPFGAEVPGHGTAVYRLEPRAVADGRVSAGGRGRR
ncbi:glycoside hydrolase family 27 protein, partial [Kitasatospora sp. MBT63]|uniref:glycoside hydrolase family 27 protein n=1 Tax=Kitasatospora sp. MBT63 TaxID=1444768 RepID=UPI0019D6C416